MSTPASLMSPSPTKPDERIFTLDAVRGIALFGIFIMNVPGFSTSFLLGADGSQLWPDAWNRGAATARDVLFSGKFNSMFSMLFAVGFTIQLQRLLERDAATGMQIYIRRLVWLLSFGLLHACIFWTGDVLHMYALLGFGLILIRKWPDRAIVGMIVATLLYAPLAEVAKYYFATPEKYENAMEQAQAWVAADNLAYGGGSFIDAVKRNVQSMVAFYTDPELVFGTLAFYVQISTTMLIGLLLGRHAFFQTAHARQPQIRQAQWIALALGIATGTTFGIWESTVENPTEPTLLRVLAGTCYILCRVSLMAFYVTTIVRIAHSDRWRSKLSLFALAGRMPLTNYLLQTLIATFFFFAWGLGYWNSVGPALGILFAVVVYFGVQIPLSAWWMSRNEQGPMEALWRRLTYGR